MISSKPITHNLHGPGSRGIWNPQVEADGPSTKDEKPRTALKKLSEIFGKRRHEAALSRTSTTGCQQPMMGMAPPHTTVPPPPSRVTASHVGTTADPTAQLVRLQMENNNLRQQAAELMGMKKSLALLAERATRSRQEIVTEVASLKNQLSHAQSALRTRDAEMEEAQSEIKKYQSLVIRTRDEQSQKLAKECLASLSGLEASPSVAELDLMVERLKMTEANSALEVEKRVLEQSVEQLSADHYKEVLTLRNRVEWAERRLAESQTAMGDLRSHFNIAMRACGKDTAELKNRYELELKRLHERLMEASGREGFKLSLDALLGSGITPRLILMLKAWASELPRTTPPSPLTAPDIIVSWTHGRFRNDHLDMTLSDATAQLLMESLVKDTSLVPFCDSLSPLVCSLCRCPKFENEFPSHIFCCCSMPVCAGCLLSTLKDGIASSWWEELDGDFIIGCPIQSCSGAWTVESEDVLRLALDELQDSDVERTVATYKRATALRAAIQNLEPRPSLEALRTSVVLHTLLELRGHMHSLFDQSTISRDASGEECELEVGTAEVYDIQHDGQNLAVPIFKSFFRRAADARGCSVCLESFHDVDYSSPANWMQSCQDFKGDWMWNVLEFPLMLFDVCRHSVDCCRSCLATHLKSQLEQYGRNHCDRLSCPSADCSRPISYEEVRLYADRETFEMYDRYRFLNTISSDPDFRWCLRDGCSNGNIYSVEGNDNAFIACDCGFSMCFVHQTPWHAGMTCAQFDSQQSEDAIKNEAFIKANTKPCPGPTCSANIEKGNFCFHMTCTNCRFEFCWVCLADWKEIKPTPTSYDPTAHKEGCFFRLMAHVEPTSLSGTDVEAAYATYEQRRARAVR